MASRYLSIWFRYLTTDWFCLRKPELKERPFVFAVAKHGRKIVCSRNALAERSGIVLNMPTADAKAIVPGLEVFDEKAGLNLKLLKGIGEWCIRYAPIVSIDPPDGLILDISGCTHLWNGEQEYLKEIISRLNSKGYYARGAIADTIGAAWATSRFGNTASIIEEAKQNRSTAGTPSCSAETGRNSITKASEIRIKSDREIYWNAKVCVKKAVW